MLNEKKINDALQLASENGHSETVRMLLDAGADVHANNDYALELASRNGHSETVRMLREAMDAAPSPQVVSSLQTLFRASTGKDLTPAEATAAFRIMRRLDGAKPSP